MKKLILLLLMLFATITEAQTKTEFLYEYSATKQRGEVVEPKDFKVDLGSVVVYNELKAVEIKDKKLFVTEEYTEEEDGIMYAQLDLDDGSILMFFPSQGLIVWGSQGLVYWFGISHVKYHY